MTNAGNLERSFLNGFCNHTNIAITNRFQSVFNNARSTNAYVDNSFRLGYTMESTSHKGIIRHSVAENYQLRTANGITVCSTGSGKLYNFAHLLNSVHIDTAFSRANAYRRANNVSYSKRFGNGSNQISIAFSVALIHQCRKATNKVYANILRSFVQSLRQGNVVITVAAFPNHRDGSNRNTLVDNGHAQFNFQIFACFYKALCLLANFIINLLRSYLNIRVSTITKADAHGDGTHVQFIFGNHACCF